MPIILHINSSINYGSTGKIAEQIGLRAMQQGWESYIAHGRYINPSASKAIQVGDKWDWWYHAFMTRLTDGHGLFSKCATRKFIKQVAKIKPDIIHLHNIHGYYLNYKLLFKYLKSVNVPVVWTLHDCWTMTGHCSHFANAKCYRWQTACFDCPQKKEYPTSLVLDRSRKNYIEKKSLFSSVDNLTLVPVSTWLAGVVKDSFLKDANVSVIRNGIDVQMFTPCDTTSLVEQYDLHGKHVILGVASPWSDKKGWSDFLQLHTKLSNEKYQVVLIGLSEAQKSHLPKGIVGLCRTNSTAELAAWYSLADAFVNMTYEDSYPTTNLEAISCGTPVVTYRTGGSPESVTPNTGRVVEQGDIDGIVEAIEDLCSVDRDILRDNCRSYAVENFDSNECFQRYIELYNELLEKRTK